MTDPYDFLWNEKFEKDEEEINNDFEQDIKAKYRYYEKKYNPTKEVD